MPIGLKNAPTIFSRVVVEAFKEFLHKFLEAYFDDWTVFSLLKNHIECFKANVGQVEAVLDCLKPEEVHFIFTIWSVVRSYCMKAGIVGRSI
jgi:hypothetical protein